MRRSTLSYLAEYIGSFFFILAIFASGGNPIIIGAALALAIFLVANHTDGHLNPAVSVAMLLNDKMEMRHFIGYVTAQILGGASAFYAYKMTKGL
jgi:aquaporin Z